MNMVEFGERVWHKELNKNGAMKENNMEVDWKWEKGETPTHKKHSN